MQPKSSVTTTSEFDNVVTSKIGCTVRSGAKSKRGREERMILASKRGHWAKRKSIRRERRRERDTYVREEREKLN